jgi:hypothetical protein
MNFVILHGSTERKNDDDDQNRQYNQHSTGRKSQAASLQGRKRSLLNAHVASCSPERRVKDSRDRKVLVQSEISRQQNLREKRMHWM